MIKLLAIFLIPLTFAQTPMNVQTVTLQNGGPPNSMQLMCRATNQPNWYKDGKQINYGNEVYDNKFRVSGATLTNTQNVGGDYIGTYSCTGPNDKTTYQVVVPGASAGLSAGAITGIVFAILFAVLLIVGGLWFAKTKGFLSSGGDDYDDEKLGNDVDDDYRSQHSAARFNNPNQSSRHLMS